MGSARDHGSTDQSAQSPAFFRLTEKETAWSLRYKHPLSVIVMDLDHFKEVNDVYGHAKADEVLVQITNVCLNAVRNSDVFARFGSEEFTALLPIPHCHSPRRWPIS